MVGTVSNIIAAKKFGFISGENGQEYFFHHSEMVSNWDELLADFNMAGGGKVKVEFEPIRTPKGPRAKNVKVIDQPA
jgi:cold shock CspA family protein